MAGGDEGFVKGTCLHMCPERELRMREREGLLHKFEVLAGTEHDKKPKADPMKIIKCFSRSAAGQNVSSPWNLRPPEVLLQTISYLLHDVINIDYCEWYKVYDFIMDRLRAVRQDMVIQNLERPYCISILQPIVRFYAYSSYRLCTENISTFDPAINNQHLQECLKRLLVFYDECDDLQNKFSILSSDDCSSYSSLFSERAAIEALYLVFNLGNTTAIDRTLQLHKQWRTSVVNYCLELSLSYWKGNWVRTCRMIKNLPSLLAAVASLHLNSIRRQALYTMSFAYNCKNISFPMELLKSLLLYNSMEDVIKDLKHYNIAYNEDTMSVHFSKASFSINKDIVPPYHHKFVDDKLSGTSLPSLILSEELF